MARLSRFTPLVLLFVLVSSSSYLVTDALMRSAEDPLARLERIVLATPQPDARYIPGDDVPLYETERRLLDAAFVLGWPVTLSDNIGDFENDPNEFGVTKWFEHHIYVRASLPQTLRTAVLAHELGHVMMPPAMRYDKGDSEIFAETVSYLVTRHEHDDPWVHARYLAQYKTHLNVLHVYRKELEFAVAILRGEIE